jgi:hypothetical protein
MKVNADESISFFVECNSSVRVPTVNRGINGRYTDLPRRMLFSCFRTIRLNLRASGEVLQHLEQHAQEHSHGYVALHSTNSLPLVHEIHFRMAELTQISTSFLNAISIANVRQQRRCTQSQSDARGRFRIVTIGSRNESSRHRHAQQTIKFGLTERRQIRQTTNCRRCLPVSADDYEVTKETRVDRRTNVY